MIHTFDPVIYPRKLWVTYDVTPEELNEMFPTGDIYGNHFKNENGYFGITCRTMDKNDKGGVLIRFADNKESMSPWNIAHEAVHAAGYICDYIDIKADWSNDEAFAYLTTWIVKCCTIALNFEKSI